MPSRCLALSERAWKPEARQAFIELAATWRKLAAETESDEALFRAICEMDLDEPYEALPQRAEPSLLGGVVRLTSGMQYLTATPASAGDKDRRQRDGNRNRHRRQRRRRRRGNNWEWYWWGGPWGY